MNECNNLCKHIQEHCSYCKEYYDVSTEEYKAKRVVNDNYVYDYLVKDKQGNIQGILNKATHYAELAWIDENTIEYIDQEWINATESNEKSQYYKCQMLNYGWCIKYYKPSIAKLMLHRGAYLKVIEIE